MKTVLVTVVCKDKAADFDLEIPAETKVSDLAESIRDAYYHDDSHPEHPQIAIGAKTPLDMDRIYRLHDEQTLAEAGVLEGHWLIVCPAADADTLFSATEPPGSSDSSHSRSSTAIPGARWRSIELPADVATDAVDEDFDDDKQGFAWRRLD